MLHTWGTKAHWAWLPDGPMLSMRVLRVCPTCVPSHVCVAHLGVYTWAVCTGAAVHCF